MVSFASLTGEFSWAQPIPRHVMRDDEMAMACVLTNCRTTISWCARSAKWRKLYQCPGMVWCELLDWVCAASCDKVVTCRVGSQGENIAKRVDHIEFAKTEHVLSSVMGILHMTFTAGLGARSSVSAICAHCRGLSVHVMLLSPCPIEQ